MLPDTTSARPARITYFVVPRAVRPAVRAKGTVRPSVTPRTTLLPIKGETVKRDLPSLLNVGEGCADSDARSLGALFSFSSWMFSTLGVSDILCFLMKRDAGDVKSRTYWL